MLTKPKLFESDSGIMESTTTQFEIDEEYNNGLDASPFINLATEEIYKVWGGT